LSLGSGWVGFDFATALGKPVRILNDAAMQALGMVIPLELGELWSRRKRALGEVLGDTGLARMGKRKWRKEVARAVGRLSAAMNVDYVILGGGNAKCVRKVPLNARIGNNMAAFRGGARLWSSDIRTHNGDATTTIDAREISVLWKLTMPRGTGSSI
jgi:polyphosphate glucokinase